MGDIANILPLRGPVQLGQSVPRIATIHSVHARSTSAVAYFILLQTGPFYLTKSSPLGGLVTDKSLQVNTFRHTAPMPFSNHSRHKDPWPPPIPQHSMLVRTRSSHLQTFVREQPQKTGVLFHATLNFGGAGWRQLMLALPIVRSLFTCKLLSVTCPKWIRESVRPLSLSGSLWVSLGLCGPLWSSFGFSGPP